MADTNAPLDEDRDVQPPRPAGPGAAPRPDVRRDIDLSQVTGFLFRRGRIIVLVTLLVSALGIAISFQLPKSYEATALIGITPTRTAVPAATPDALDPAQTDAIIDTETEVLRSPEIMTRLVEDRGLVHDPNWNPDFAPPGLLHRVRNRISEPERSVRSDEEVINLVALAVADAMTIERKDQTKTIEVTVASASPVAAAEVANAVFETYRGWKQETSIDASEQSNAWLRTRLEDLRGEVEAREAEIHAFLEANRTEGLGTSDHSEAQISDIQQAIVAARSDHAEKEARFNQLQRVLSSGGTGASLPDVLRSEVIRDLRVRQAEIAQREADLRTQYGDQHPELVRVAREREGIATKISDEVQRIMDSVENEMRVARARLASLEGTLSEARGDQVTNEIARARLVALETDLEATRAVYSDFLTRYHEVQSRDILPPVTAQLVSSARVPISPSYPNMPLALALSVLAGLGAGLLAAILAESLHRSLMSPEDVFEHTGLVTLSSVPLLPRSALKVSSYNERHPAGYLLARPKSAFAESFKVLKTALTHGSKGKRPRVIAVTSAVTEEGKTSTSLALARTFAMAGTKVVLVDCDHRRCSINDLLVIEPVKALRSVLKGQTRWQDAVALDDASGAHVLPCEPAGKDNADELDEAAMERLIDELAAAYEVVIMDCAPVLVMADARILASKADATLLTCEWRTTDARAVQSAVDQLRRVSANVVGVVLNKVHPRSPGMISFKDAIYYSRAGKYYHN